MELRRIAFDAESESSSIPGSGTEKRKAMYTKDYKMLGFTVGAAVSCGGGRLLDTKVGFPFP